MITEKRLKKAIDKYGITKASKKLKIGFKKIKKYAEFYKIEIKLKKIGVGRKSNKSLV